MGGCGRRKTILRRSHGYFKVASKFDGDFGAYRSPLKFDDGRVVRDAADWAKRRAEILAYWQGVMGPWPKLLERPKVEVLRSEKRDNFVQQRVRVEIAPGQGVEGWLLVPEGRGPFAAVVVPFYEPETSVGLKGKRLDFGYQLARRGFVTLSIGSPGGDARRPESGEADLPAAVVSGVCGGQLPHGAGAAAGCGWQADRDRGAQLWGEVGDVRIVPVREVRVRGLERSGDRVG